jgi:glycosyltransferase involved in cell wall biosynthesis
VRVYLLSPYHTGSHRQWAEGYRSASRHDVVLVTHEGRFWTWRLTGGFVTMAQELRDALARHGPPDALLATSMLDLAGLLGLTRREVGGTPVALYLHENQVTYPQSGRTRTEAFHGLINWAAVLAADSVAFNSEFHRESFFSAVPGLLRSFPDRSHEELVGAALASSRVLPVGIDLQRLDPPAERGGPLRLLWNHRWDDDKDPGSFLAALEEVLADGHDVRVVLAGERFAGQADRYAAAVDRLGDAVLSAGHLPEARYCEALRRADVVVSTARQEFFGVSIVEAVYAGAMPLLPDRLVYRERVPAELAERCLYRGLRALVAGLRWAARHPDEARAIGAGLRPLMRRYDWSVLAPVYDDWLEGLVISGRDPDRGGGGALPAT